MTVSAMLLGAGRAVPAQSAPDTSVRVVFGGFVDTYIAYDFGRPRSLDRVFTTQAARHAEFNVNLAFVEARLSGARVRGRLALQAGTSVQANYAAEPRVGSVSGPDVARSIQEAVVGYRIAPELWLDAGVYFAPYGAESWISSENWTYTRSLIADNSPYYQSGIRATWSATSRLGVQLHVMNGWQNISETNSDKALGLRIEYAPSPRAAVAYDAFVGNEQPDSLAGATRVFQELSVRLQPNARLAMIATLDHGRQGPDQWRGWAVIGRYQLSRVAWLAARMEAYSDPEQVIVVTGTSTGLRANGASVNLDVAPHPSLTWRLELRGLRSPDAAFPSRTTASGLSSQNAAIVTSIAMRL